MNCPLSQEFLFCVYNMTDALMSAVATALVCLVLMLWIIRAMEKEWRSGIDSKEKEWRSGIDSKEKEWRAELQLLQINAEAREQRLRHDFQLNREIRRVSFRPCGGRIPVSKKKPNSNC